MTAEEWFKVGDIFGVLAFSCFGAVAVIFLGAWVIDSVNRFTRQRPRVSRSPGKDRFVYALAMFGPSVFWVTAFWVYNTYLYPGVIQ